jgi:hypothetical protein
VICPSTWLRVVVSLSNHLLFVICYLKFFNCRNLNPAAKHLLFLTTCCQIKPDKGLIACECKKWNRIKLDRVSRENTLGGVSDVISAQ